MPVVETALWKHPGNPGMIVVTSSASLDEEGRLYMRYGEGLEATRRIPEIEVQAGRKVKTRLKNGIYGFLPVRPSRPKAQVVGFGLFQTRHDWDEPDDPELIRRSMDRLRHYLGRHSGLKIRMDFPGLNSGLEAEDVALLLEPIPDAVTLCHQGEVAPHAPYGMTGAKELYILVERWVMEGRFSFAVDYLVDQGYDRKDAAAQVASVQREIRERAERYTMNNSKDWQQRVFF